MDFQENAGAAGVAVASLLRAHIRLTGNAPPRA
jgi:hypothetical protein